MMNGILCLRGSRLAGCSLAGLFTAIGLFSLAAQAQTEAAAGQLPDASESQLASERAAVAEFWDRYYNSFNPLRAEMAATPISTIMPTTAMAVSSMALPSWLVHLSGCPLPLVRDGRLHRD